MRPLPAATAAFVVGTALGAWLPQEPGAWERAGLVLLAAWVAALASGRLRAGGIAGLAVFVVAGICRCQMALVPVFAGANAVAEGDAVVCGRVARPSEVRDGDAVIHLESVRLRRDGATWRLAGPLQLLVAGAGEGPAVGDILVARGSVRAIRGDRNLGWFPGPVAPQARRYAARLTVASPAMVRRAGHDPGSGPAAAVLRWRAAADRFWKARPGAAGGILNALTTGERTGIPAAVQEGFLRAGLAHLLAISGMNVGFLAAAVFLALRRALALVEPFVLRFPAQTAAAALTLPSLWFFLLFSGEQIPVGRAALSGAAALAAAVVWRRIEPGDACALAAAALVALDPQALFSASFQLSFAAVAALLLAAPRLAAESEPQTREAGTAGRLRRGARALAVASLAATAATAPLVAFHFQQLSLVGPFANLVAVPLTGFLVLPAAWLTLAAAAVCSPAAAVAADVAAVAADALVAVAAWFAGPAWACLSTARPPPLLTLCLLGLALALLPPPTRRLLAAGTAACAAAAAAAAWWAIAAHRARLLVAVLDVGQGLAVAVLLPGGGSLLYDAGPRWRGFDAGERLVVPSLRRLGVRRLGTLAISHNHPDHAGGAAAVLRELGAGKVLTGGEREGAVRGQAWRAGDVALRVLNPPAAGEGPQRLDENGRSLALLLAWKDAGVLLTGDVGPPTVAGLVEAARPPPRHLLLQAPHHGGSAVACGVLAAALHPDLAVIPVGRNSYGHPHPGAEAALAAHGRVLRSDRDGAVLAWSDGGGFAVRTWRELSRDRSWAERVRWLAEGW